MPDFERIYRKLHLDLAKDEQEGREIAAFYRGQDSARKQIALIVAIFATVTVLFAWALVP